MADKLEDLHLADLHRRAEKLGIPHYRLLRRDRLVAEIQSGDGEARQGSVRERERLEEAADRERERFEEAETEDVVGILEVTPQRYGFLRFGALDAQVGDVYVSASQI